MTCRGPYRSRRGGAPGTDDLRRGQGLRRRTVDRVPGVLAARPGQRRDGRAHPTGRRGHRVPGEPAGPGAAHGEDVAARARRLRRDQPVLLRDHPRRRDRGDRGRLHPARGGRARVGDGGAQGARAGAAPRRGGGARHVAHVGLGDPGHGASSARPSCSTACSPASRASSPTTPAGPVGRWSTWPSSGTRASATSPGRRRPGPTACAGARCARRPTSSTLRVHRFGPCAPTLGGRHGVARRRSRRRRSPRSWPTTTSSRSG